MTHFKPLLLLLLVLSFFLAIMGAALATPSATLAHPAYGFTPQPPPPPPPPPDDGDEEEVTETPSEETTPTDWILVRMEECDLECRDDYGDGGDSSSAGLASVEVTARVRLVHQGSGWIAEGALSDAGTTRLAVPYPGRWEVFLLEEPAFMTAETVDTSKLDFESLRQNLALAPVSLGMVEANTEEPQMIKCPVLCVTEPPPSDAPDYLPVTGTEKDDSLVRLLLGAAFLILVGALLYRAGPSIYS